ncbi:MAG: flagellar basal body P-ring protein FlgI [Planctomycetaceae bacterium]|jgi:hypothetical protein|nr:flagellar basal body P-ring protein FlgI [Planctomycetaceae bacterium]
MQRPFIFAVIFTVLLSAILLSVPTACSHLKANNKDELSSEKFKWNLENGKPMLVGDCTTIGNYVPIQVQGFGLVKNLAGTGADDINSMERKIVYDEMTRLGVGDTRSIMADPSTAVVNVLGYLRPGIREGDLFDVEVRLPPETEAKSLRGGWLMTAKLYETAYVGGSQPLQGKTKAFVEGPIMIDDPLATETKNPVGLKQGIILSGARMLESRPIIVNMKSGAESAFITDRIAKEINHRFYISTGQKKGMATAKTDSMIVLDVHPHYANDVARYLKVVQSIACYENTTKRMKRIEELKEKLMIPGKSQNAAFQLEAVGKEGIPALREGLKSKDVEVQFYAAVSLAYLGDNTPAKVLTKISMSEPAFRVYTLNALSVMRNDIEAETGLQELLHVPSAETRYGAFRALRNRNPYDRTIRGENLGSQFSYHGINTPGNPMIHLSKSKRPEVVMFGTDIRLRQPFMLDAGPSILVNGQQPGQVVVKKLVLSGVDQQRVVSNGVDEIIRAVVELGGTYPDVYQMLHQASQAGVLPCRLEVDCLPEPNRIYRRPGGNDEEKEQKTEAEPPKKKTALERMNPKTWFEENPGGKSTDYEGTTNTSVRE